VPIKKVLAPVLYDTRMRVPVKVWTDEIEESAENQLVQLAHLPFLHKHIAVMPDVHAGIGSTVGSVIATKKAIVPAAVGVDIGCGMMAVRTGLLASQLPDSLAEMRSAIEAAVPHGRTDNGGPNDKGGWRGEPSDFAIGHMRGMRNVHGYDLISTDVKFRGNPENHMGTLGTGNHFVEVCLDKEGHVWVMLHSGSRGIGNAIGRHYIEKAKEQMARWHIGLVNSDLAYLPEGEQLFKDYWNAVSWAQSYAMSNREVMMEATLRAIEGVMDRKLYPDMHAINCHHNYVSLENHFGENVYVTRKGAVRARAGDLGIIPGSRARAIQSRSAAAATELAGRCPAPRLRGSSRWRTWLSRPLASSAARTRTWSTRFRAPTRTSTR
jgi:tRNA-splicing ligase RtcB